jgi:hypothetical protein
MPIARIITSNPQAVCEVAQALSDSGYEVDIVSPASIPNTPVDLEINLSSAASAESISANADHSQAPEWDSYEYDVPIEREFILAPAWRSLISRLKESWNRLRPPREEQTAPVPAPVPAQIQIQYKDIAPAQRKRLLVLSAFLSRIKNHAVIFLAKVPPLLAKARIRTTSLIVAVAPHIAQAASISRNRTAQLRDSMFAWRHRMPRSENTVHAPAIAKHTRDYLWHQSWPIAAGILLSFLLGWVAATHSSSPAKQALQPAAAMSVVSPGVVPTRQIQKPRAQRKVLNATATPKPNPNPSQRTVRKSSPNIEAHNVAEDEVIVRHYPSKAVTAQNRQQRPKRFSDIN